MTSRSHILLATWFRAPEQIPGLDRAIRPVDATTYELLRLIRHPLFVSSSDDTSPPGDDATEAELEAYLAARDLAHLHLVADYLWIHTATDDELGDAFRSLSPADHVRAAARAARFPLPVLDAAAKHISDSIAEINAALTEDIPDPAKKNTAPPATEPARH
jgi:hypothetical protein